MGGGDLGAVCAEARLRQHTVLAEVVARHVHLPAHGLLAQQDAHRCEAPGVEHGAVCSEQHVHRPRGDEEYLVPDVAGAVQKGVGQANLQQNN